MPGERNDSWAKLDYEPQKEGSTVLTFGATWRAAALRTRASMQPPDS